MKPRSATAEHRAPRFRRGERNHRRQAHDHAARGELPEAVATLAEAIRKEPLEPALYEDLAKLCLLAGQPAKALEVAESLEVVDPHGPRALYLQGIANLLLGRVTLAKKRLKTALARAPACTEIRQALAKVCDILGEPEKSRALLEEALVLEEAAPGPATELGRQYLRSPGKPALAVGVLERALLRSPNDPEANLNLALACARDGDAKRAQVCARRALRGRAEIADQAKRLLDALDKPWLLKHDSLPHP